MTSTKGTTDTRLGDHTRPADQARLADVRALERRYWREMTGATARGDHAAADLATDLWFAARRREDAELAAGVAWDPDAGDPEGRGWGGDTWPADADDGRGGMVAAAYVVLALLLALAFVAGFGLAVWLGRP